MKTREQEREDFEAWYISRGLLRPSRSTEPGYTDQYDNPVVQGLWMGWEARSQVKL